MTKRGKILQIVGVLIAFLIVLFLVQGRFSFTLSMFADFMDVATMRLLLLGLIAIVTLQAIGLYILAKRGEIMIGSTPARRIMDTGTEQRGRGRPRKPCVLALTGVMPCPLEPDHEIDPDFVARVSEAVANLQHEKLVTPSMSKEPAEIFTKPVEVTQNVEEPPTATKAEAEPKTEDNEGKENKESIGEVLVGMADVLLRRKKDEKKVSK
jgi:hypothetical protein